MANKKITELNEATSVSGNDWLVIVDVANDETKKVHANQVGGNIPIQDTAPEDPEEDDLWIDTDEENTLRYFDGTNWNDVSNTIAGDTLPIGSIVPYGSTTAPTNWLVCDGSAVSRTAYSELFAVIGTSYGAGDGSTTFNLPNLKGKVPVGYNSSETEFDTMGETGGSKALQSHTHNVKLSKDATGTGYVPVASTTGGFGSNFYETYSEGTGNSGNLQPYQVVCYIIKAKQSAGLVASVGNTYSTSQTDTYSCDYLNGEVVFTGTQAGEVTLNKSTVGYSYIEIMYTNADGEWGCTGKVPIIQNNKISILSHSYRDNQATLCLWPSTLLISGNKLTPQTSKWVYSNTNGTIGFGSGNYVNVKKVILYK